MRSQIKDIPSSELKRNSLITDKSVRMPQSQIKQKPWKNLQHWGTSFKKVGHRF